MQKKYYYEKLNISKKRRNIITHINRIKNKCYRHYQHIFSL